MPVLPKIARPRASEDDISIVDSARLSYYPITEWDVRVIIVLWVLFFVTLVFVVLRLYSRVKILQFYALEDYLYNLAFVSPGLPTLSLLFHSHRFPSVRYLFFLLFFN